MVAARLAALRTIAAAPKEKVPDPLVVADGDEVVAPRSQVRITALRAPTSPPPLTQPLPGVAAPAEDAGACRQRLTTEDERHRMVGRHLARSDRVCWAVPGMKVTMGFA